MSFFFNKKRIDRKGFTLIDLMVAMGIGSIAVIATVSIISQAGRVRRAENLLTGAFAVRQQIFENLARYDNFQSTIHYSTNNTKFACLKTHSCAVGAQPATTNNFDLRIATGGTYAGGFTSNVFYTTSNLNSGFTPDGVVCSPTPTVASPSKVCPIRVDLSWENLCDNSTRTCNPGMIRIFVTIKTFQPDPRVPVTFGNTRVSPYGFEMIKSVYDVNESAPYP